MISFVKKFIHNQRGVSLVQLGIALGITGALSLVMLKQTTTTQKSNSKFKKVSDINMFTADLAIKLGSKQSCEATLKGKTFTTDNPTTINELKMLLPTGDEKIIAEIGKKYVGETLEVEDIKVIVAGPENLEIVMTYKNLNIKQGYNKLIKSFTTPVVTTVSGTNYTVTDCFFSDTEAVTGITNNINAICEGDGVIIDAASNCQIKDYIEPYASTLNCPLGESLVDITYNATTYTYSGVCKKVFEIDPGCVGKRVKNVGTDGILACLNVADIIDSTSKPQLFENSVCELIYASGKLKLECSCAPSCAAANTICQGTIDNTSNKCGSPCGTAGTKTTGSCENCTPDPATCNAPAANVCVGETAYGYDNCGSPCSKPGTKTDGSCASCTGCSADPSTVCIGDTAFGVDSCGSPCSVPGTKTCSCTPSCPAAADVCQGTTNNDPDGCGGFCNVAGTKTTAPCGGGPDNCTNYINANPGSRCCGQPKVPCCHDSNPGCISGGPEAFGDGPYDDGLWYYEHSYCPPGFSTLESGTMCIE
jgi:hypothetical protein